MFKETTASFHDVETPQTEEIQASIEEHCVFESDSHSAGASESDEEEEGETEPASAN